VIETRLHRVFGPPGCGKTTFLADQANKAAARFGGAKLIVASLTRAAAAEVAGRDTSIPAKNIGTLHAHAYRALGHPELAETKEGLKDWNEQTSFDWRLLSAVRDPEWSNPEETSSKTDGDKLFAKLSILRATLVPPHSWPARVADFAEHWEHWKRETQRLDFTDLIERARLIPHPLNPRIVFLDEAQDMSMLEMSLALHWAVEAEQTVIVGDPDQCLYEWRGSTQDAFLGPAAVSERVLSQSYRVPRAVHAYAVPWINQIPDRAPVAYEPRDADGSVESIHATFDNPTPILTAVGAQENGTSMILASCAYMLAPVIRELRAAGVPFHNPYRTKNGKWNPLAGVARPLGLLRPHASVWGSEHRWWTWNELRRWLEPMSGGEWLERGTKADVDRVCEGGRWTSERDEQVPLDYIVSMLRKTPEGKAAGRALTESDPVRLLAWWAENLRPKEWPRFEYVLTIAERFGLTALRETPRVIVGTIHSVKGGEADTVYVFPDLSLAAWTGVDGESGWSYGGEGRDPIIRLFYVAFTRARQHLRLCFESSNLAVEWPAPNPPSGG
jgi:DNA helicase II / ATP-dependent DNA helicase PcrA